MIVIDGSYGEGGGQIVRSTLTLAVLTGQAVRIEAIRAGRQKPGLQAQHLTAVRAAAAVCMAELQGDSLGSTRLEFVPTGPPLPGQYTFDVAEARHGSSAGSSTLVFQSVFLPLALTGGDSHLLIRGGSHVPWSPPLPYIKHVFLPAVWPMGLRAEATLNRYGWYPAGGGEVEFKVDPPRLSRPPDATATGDVPKLAPIQLTERGDLKQVWGLAAVSNLPSHIAQRMANRAVNQLKADQLAPAKVEAAHVEASGPGVGIFLFAEYQYVTAGFCAYGRKGLPAEKVADQACAALLAHHRSQAAADSHLSDQLVLPAALAGGCSRWSCACVTSHLITNAWVTQQFIPCRVDISGSEGEAGEVVITHV